MLAKTFCQDQDQDFIFVPITANN